MADTFLARTILSPTAPTVETLVYPGAAYIEHGCLLGVYNSFGSNRLLTVKCIDVTEQLGRSGTAQVRTLLTRTTAQSGGEPISATKMDSASASIPSQVQMAKYPVITVTGSPFREINAMDGNIPTTALMGLLVANAATGAGGLGIADYTAMDANVQGMVLREGQGFAITTNLTAPSPFAVEFRIALLVGTEMHQISEVIPISSHAAVIGIHNGVGSGVVITIVRCVMRQIRTSDLLRLVTIERISGLYGGTDITPVAMDSASTGLSPGVLVRQDGSATQANLDSNMGAQKKAGGDQPFRRLALPYFGIHPQLASLNLWAKQRAFDSMQTIGDVVLREGEGLGVFQRVNACGRGDYEVMMGFTATVTGSSGGGETSYTF